jgi:hypothetical protein
VDGHASWLTKALSTVLLRFISAFAPIDIAQTATKMRASPLLGFLLIEKPLNIHLPREWLKLVECIWLVIQAPAGHGDKCGRSIASGVCGFFGE